ncbi:hypothetical protein LGT36_005975 [Demequina sp. TMPB413]|uniref:hypothetical protein n=1 Tax=Demequina sp. TMPB413 TaxID=2881056 RepID=UPI002009F565|nr:hypothetical protein [Demequina sp. TMPB413]UPU89473.1 hypothetical protein LGT36_005975 [Demequina sp. TMPB413]
MPVLVAVAVALTLTAGSITGETTDDSIISHGTEAAAQLGAPTAGASSSDRWMRHELCREWFTVELTGEMFPGVWDDEIPECATVLPPPPNFCPDGEVALAPWWVSRHLGDGVYGPWRQTGGHQCTSDILYTQVAQAWASMPIAPNTYDVQPEGGYAVAELGVNLIVDTNPRTMDVTLLGTPVTIRAVPTLYTWTNTDGTVWTSTDPGKPYADGGEPFTFPRTPEHRTTFTLTTTWRGEFTTNGGATWRDAPGTATTTSGATTVHVYNPHTHRVDCDLDGNCVNGTQGGGNQKTVFDPDGDGILNYQIPDNKIDDYLTTRDAEKKWTDPERKNTG